MDIEYIEKIIVIIGSIGTFGAAIIAYWTLREIKRQRINAQKPQILFNTLTTGYIDISVIPNKVPVDWQGKTEHLKAHVLFEMINAGQDIAKNIEIEYKLDIDSFVKLLAQHDIDNDITISYDEEWISFTSNTDKIDEKVFLKVNAGITDKLEFLLTRSIQEKPSGFAIPKEYLILNSCLSFLSKKHDFTVYTNEIPMIYMKTSYEDVSGKKDHIFQAINTSYIKGSEFNFSIKRITKKEFYAA